MPPQITHDRRGYGLFAKRLPPHLDQPIAENHRLNTAVLKRFLLLISLPTQTPRILRRRRQPRAFLPQDNTRMGTGMGTPSKTRHHSWGWISAGRMEGYICLLRRSWPCSTTVVLMLARCFLRNTCNRMVRWLGVPIVLPTFRR